MFCVLYEFHIKDGFEEAFQKEWHDLTKVVITQNGSLGARLHRRDDGAFIAYAQWPNRAQWEKGHHSIEQSAVAKHVDQEFTRQPIVVMTMEVTDDLLVTD